MPITIGSVGDIISLCLLIKDLIDTLDKSKGASVEYQTVVRELQILDRALLEVEVLVRAHAGSVDIEALYHTVCQTVDQCRTCLGAFLRRLKKYNAGLGSGVSSSAVSKVLKSVKWQVSERDELERFRATVAAHSASINILLTTASVKLVSLNGQKTHARMEEKDRDDRSVSRKILDKLDENNRLIVTGNAVASRVMDALRLAWLYKLGGELKAMMCRIVSLNMATYKAVISIQASMPTYSERTLLEEPFFLEDAIGRLAPVHLQFISSWEAFDAILEIRFKDIPGQDKVRNKEYLLQERATGREISRSRRWDVAFLPGQNITMSMIFQEWKPTVDQSIKDWPVDCPRCGLCHTSATNDICCQICGMWYRREIEETDRLFTRETSTLRQQCFQPGEYRSSATSSNGSTSTKRKHPLYDVSADIQEFKGVRLVTKIEKAPCRKAVYKQHNEIKLYDKYECWPDDTGLWSYETLKSLRIANIGMTREEKDFAEWQKEVVEGKSNAYSEDKIRERDREQMAWLLILKSSGLCVPSRCIA